MNKELLVEAIGNYMIVVGCQSTTSCNRWFDFKYLADHFEITVDKVRELKDDILDYLYSCEQICDEEGAIIEGDSFDLMFFGNYCNVDCEED